MIREKKGCLIFFLVFISIIGLGILFIEKKEVEPMPLVHYNYEDLSIVSSIKPPNTNLWFELSSGGLYAVSSQSSLNIKVYYSSDKGDNWTQLDVDPSNSSADNKSRDQKIHSAWHDRGNSVIWFVDCDQNANDFDVWKLDYSGGESQSYINVTEIGTSSGADAGSVIVIDIWVYGGNTYVANEEDRTGTRNLVVWDVDTAPFTEKDTSAIGATYGTKWSFGLLDVEGDDRFYWFGDSVSGPNDGVVFWGYDAGLASLIGGSSLSALDNLYTMPDSKDDRWVASDGNYNYLLAKRLSDSELILIKNDIGDTGAAAGSIYDVRLMLERNTDSNEKGFHTSLYEVYELHPNLPHQLHVIGSPASDAALIAITDNFLMNNDGDMFEYTDLTSYIIEVDFQHQIQNYPKGIVKVDASNITVQNGMFMVFKSRYTAGGVSQTSVNVFEGFVRKKDSERRQKVWLESPAKRELKTITPNGSYSGSNQSVINTLISDNCNYITVGTLAAGTALGTVNFRGEVSLRTILDQMALLNNFVWYLDPTGQLYFNGGAVDSTVNYDETSKIWKVRYDRLDQPVNYVVVKGAIASGAQLTSTPAQDIELQQRYGIIKKAFTISWLNSQSLVNLAATNILARIKLMPNVAQFWAYDTTYGLIRVGEEITLSYNKDYPSISSDQYKITRSRIFRDNTVRYEVSDELL